MTESRRLSVTEEREEALRPVVDEGGGRLEGERERRRRWKREDGRNEGRMREEGVRT